MKNRAPGIGTQGPAELRNREDGPTSVAAVPDRIETRHARRIRLHRVLKQRRRHSKELDELLDPKPPVDVWAFSEPIGDPYRDTHMDRSVQWRDYEGRRLLDDRWLP